jgi:hypothetical protein
VCVLAKSPGRCISSGALSREVGGALESALEIVEGMVGGGRFLGGNYMEKTRLRESQSRLRRSAADVRIGKGARVGRG